MLIPFGETLRRLRMERGLSQQQLANMLHVERSSFSNWEAGRRLPDTAMISRIANTLGVDVAVLLSTAESPDAPRTSCWWTMIASSLMEACPFCGRLCRDLIRLRPQINVVYLTAFRDYFFDAWDTGACGFMLKPLEVEAVHRQLLHLRYPVGGPL